MRKRINGFIGHCSIFLLCFTVTVGFALPAAAQDSIKETLFRSANMAMKDAEEKQAKVYAPGTYGKAMKYYNDADKAFDKGGSLDSIRKDIAKSEEYFYAAGAVAERAMGAFASLINAREEAASVNAQQYDRKNWEKGEDLFQDAIEYLEKNSDKRALSKTQEAEKYYRAAELSSIKTEYLKGAWHLLEKADDMRVGKYAPRTLERTQALVKEAEAMLAKDRYNTDRVRKLAQDARYEAQHAFYLYEAIQKHDDQDRTLEDMMLSAEIPIQRIAETMNIQVKFDQGLDAPTQSIITAIRKLDTDNSRMSKTIKQKEKQLLALENQLTQQSNTMQNQLSSVEAEKEQLMMDKEAQISDLQTKIVDLEARLAKVKSAEEKLKGNAERQQVRRDKINKIKSSFSPDEGTVLLDGNGNIIIRLHGIDFPSGTAIIQPEYFGLLKKVMNAFNEFPDSKVKIEGHTDSVGSNEVNLKLSIERAAAVQQYVLANSEITPARIAAEGFGESRPIANNETREGQAKNRRIDVVVMPPD